MVVFQLGTSDTGGLNVLALKWDGMEHISVSKIENILLKTHTIWFIGADSTKQE